MQNALKEYEKKFKDKSGHKWADRQEPAKKGKYTFIERSYEDDSEESDAEEKVKNEDDDVPEIKSKLPVKSQRLIELIFNQNHFNSVLEGIGYNADKLPLGKLSKTTLRQGFDHLNELASLIKHPSLAASKHDMAWDEVSRPHQCDSSSCTCTLRLEFYSPQRTQLCGDVKIAHSQYQFLT